MSIGYQKDPYERKAGGTVQDGGDKIQMVQHAEVMGHMLPTAFVDHGWPCVGLGSEASDLQR